MWNICKSPQPKYSTTPLSSRAGQCPEKGPNSEKSWCKALKKQPNFVLENMQIKSSILFLSFFLPLLLWKSSQSIDNCHLIYFSNCTDVNFQHLQFFVAIVCFWLHRWIFFSHSSFSLVPLHSHSLAVFVSSLTLPSLPSCSLLFHTITNPTFASCRQWDYYG